MNNTPKNNLVFVSYNKADNDIAREIAIFIAAEDISVWFDEWEIGVGDSIVEKLDIGLDNCTAFIILWSSYSEKSDWVRAELRSTLSRAISNGDPRIVPILLDDTPLPPLLRDVKHIKYHGGVETDRTEIIDGILGRIPTQNYIKAIVKKYNELIYDSVTTENLFGLNACPHCGSMHLEVSCAQFADEVDVSLNCKECGETIGGF